MPHAICVTLVTRFVSIIQVSKGRVQTCKINFYCSDDLFLKTLRNNQIQVFLFPFFCCISPFLLSRCIVFCDLQCDASFSAIFFSKRTSVYILWNKNSQNESSQASKIFQAKTGFLLTMNLDHTERSQSTHVLA